MSFFNLLNGISLPINYDPNALDYFNRVQNTGGTLTTIEKNAINTLVTSLKYINIWNKYKEIGIHMGGFNSSFEKLNYVSSGSSRSINNGFVITDYSSSSGLTGNGTNKNILTGLFFSAVTVDNRNLSLGFYSTTNLVATSIGVGLGNTTSSGFNQTYLCSTATQGNAGISNIRVSNIGQSSCIGMVSLCAGTTAQGGIRTYQNGSVRDIKGQAGVGSPAGQLSVFSFNNSNFYKGSISAYYIASFLTSGETMSAATIWNNFHISIGRNSSNRNVFFGDSITYGLVNTGVAGYNSLRWSTLINNDIGGLECNLGISGTVLQNTTPTITGNGRDRFNGDVLGQTPNYIYILYGVNDLRYNGTGFTSTIFQTQLEEIIQLALNSGVSANKIVVGSPPYQNPSFYSAYTPYNAGTIIKHEDYRDKAFAAATNKHVMYADVYQYMKDNGGNSLLSSDGVHPNTTGYTAIYTSLINAIQL